MTRNPKLVNYAAKTGNAPKWRGKDRPMSDDLVMRLREPTFYTHPTAEDGKLAADRIEQLERERERYLRHLTAGAQSINDYKARAEAAEAALAAMTKNKDVILAAVQRFSDMADEWKDARDEAIRRRDAWRAKAEGFDEMAAAVRAKIKAEPDTWSRILLRAALIESLARLAKAVDALREIAEQTKGVTPEPDNLQMTIGTIHSYARATLAEIGGA